MWRISHSIKSRLPRRYLASHGVRYITLLGRSGHLTQQLRSDLCGLLDGDWGVCVTIARCDTAAAAEVLAVMDDGEGVTYTFWSSVWLGSQQQLRSGTAAGIAVVHPSLTCSALRPDCMPSCCQTRSITPHLIL